MSVDRLDRLSLDTLPAAVARPGYQPCRHEIGIVHLGLGAFHKAHQAVYTDKVLAANGGDWTIAGVSLRSPRARDELLPQDGLYTLGVSEGTSQSLRVIGAIRDVLVAPEDPLAVIELLARESIHIVTLTVTEKGYCLDPASGKLEMQHPDIRHDLEFPDAPRSAIGFLCAAIQQRAKTSAPFTIISCDNLAGNGEKLEQAVRAMLQPADPDVLAWMETGVRFPSTMVDRIVPAMTADAREDTARMLGLRDHACVRTEPFSQWVIEDDFAGPRPAWEDAGATIVADVAPYEAMKLRLLNGPHSAIAYLGCLGGHTFVHEAMQDATFAAFIQRLMEREIAPEVVSPASFDLPGYTASLRRRFANSALRHRTAQIAMDGSQKIPQRLLPVIRQRLAKGLPIACSATVLAAWMRYATGRDLAGKPLAVDDPMSGQLADIVAAAPDGEALVRAMLSVEVVFGSDLGHSAALVAAVAAAMRHLECGGVGAAMAACLGDEEEKRT